MSDTTESASSNNEIPEPTQNEIDQVSDILRDAWGLNEKEPETAPDDAPGGDANASTEGDETEPEPKPEGEEGEQEEETDADKKAFYAKEFTLSDGTVMTVGEAKDIAQEFQSRTLELIDRETALNARHYQLQRMTQYMNLTPEQIQDANEENRQHLAREGAQMLEVIPELKDPARFERARADMYADLRPYGFQDYEIAQLADHRLVHYIHDAVKLKQGIRAAKASVKPMRSPEPKARRTQTTPKGNALNQQLETAQRTGNLSDARRYAETLLSQG